MKFNKKQLIDMIIMQAENLEKNGEFKGAKAIEKATIQVNELIKGLTKNKLDLYMVLDNE